MNAKLLLKSMDASNTKDFDQTKYSLFVGTLTTSIDKLELLIDFSKMVANVIDNDNGVIMIECELSEFDYSVFKNHYLGIGLSSEDAVFKFIKSIKGDKELIDVDIALEDATNDNEISMEPIKFTISHSDDLVDFKCNII